MLLALILALLVFLVLAFRGLGFFAWLAGAGVLLIGWSVTGVAHPALFATCVIALVALAALFGLPPLRSQIVSRFIMPLFAKVLPRLGETERIALDAGTVWWDADLFAGIPPWQKLLDFPIKPPSTEELAFLNGPVEELCRRINDWEVEQQRDLPPDIWAFMKEHRFFGMIIPKEYGGLGFSAIGHARRSIASSTSYVSSSV